MLKSVLAFTVLFIYLNNTVGFFTREKKKQPLMMTMPYHSTWYLYYSSKAGTLAGKLLAEFQTVCIEREARKVLAMIG